MVTVINPNPVVILQTDGGLLSTRTSCETPLFFVFDPVLSDRMLISNRMDASPVVTAPPTAIGLI